MQNKQSYCVKFTFVPQRVIKRQPETVTGLATGIRHDDPNDQQFYRFAEQTRLVPGDNVLVVADQPGEIAISDIGCTPSRPWDRETYDATRSLPGFNP
ncbi:MAG: hypothetical protein ABI411_16905 [Tahibacter sp.]